MDFVKRHEPGTTVLGALQYPHPGDKHLILVICQVLREPHHEYVVWTYNAQFGGFHNGGYHAHYSSAVVEFSQRIDKMPLGLA